MGAELMNLKTRWRSSAKINDRAEIVGRCRCGPKRRRGDA
jgi:hypothetical protein